MGSELHRCHVLFDTHCHLDAPPLAGSLDNILRKAGHEGVCRYIVPGVAPEDWECIGRLAAKYGSIYPAYGLHPMHASRWSAGLAEKLSSTLSGAVAIGEIGLDYFCKDQPRNVQADAFRQQLAIAVAAGLPVLIHCRGAFRDLLSILEEEHVFMVGGIMHAFSGSPEIAEACIRLGLLISVAGPVTYRNSVKPVRVVEKVPLASIVLETDAPDMTPEPYRGRFNEPAFLPLIAAAVAGIKGVPYAEVAGATSANAAGLFRW